MESKMGDIKPLILEQEPEEANFDDDKNSVEKTNPKDSNNKKLLSDNLKKLEGKFIKIDDMLFKMNNIKMSEDEQGIILLDCNQQRISADLINKPKFKFFGRKIFKYKCSSELLYDDSGYEFNKNGLTYFGINTEEINEKKRDNSLEYYTYDKICPLIEAKR